MGPMHDGSKDLARGHHILLIPQVSAARALPDQPTLLFSVLCNLLFSFQVLFSICDEKLIHGSACLMSLSDTRLCRGDVCFVQQFPGVSTVPGT